MLEATEFKILPIGAVPGGHLVAFELHQSAYVALRVTMPDRDGEAAAGTLQLLPIDPPVGPARLMTFDDMHETPCIDLGPAAIRVPERALFTVPSGDRSSGYDLLIGTEGAAITAYFGPRGFDRCTWSVLTGMPVIAQHQVRRFPQWEIGVTQGTDFRSVASFPLRVE